MLIIGERINGMFKKVGEAIAARDKKAIRDLARRELEAGAGMLDVNVGTAARDREGAMAWLVETIREETDAPLSIDSSNPEVVEAGLKACAGTRALINSTTAEDEKLDRLVALAVEYKAGLLGLTLDEKGIPSTKDQRVLLGAKILFKALEAGLEPGQVHIDPVVLPAKVAQEGNQTVKMLETIRELKILNDPPPRIVVGLSNISNGALKEMRPLINRTYLVMALTCGLDEAIADPFDKDLVDAMITAEMLLCKAIYADDFIKAYKASQSG
jgi:5-methyltetrahydrofolate corrinoid/iron sulfur protein methyltransferase